MSPARWPRTNKLADRLLILDPDSGAVRHARMDALEDILGPTDLLVVNDAATLPASQAATTEDGGALELRFATAPQDGRAWAVVFGSGSWRDATEDRGAGPSLRPGDVLSIGPTLKAKVVALSELSGRLIELEFKSDGDEGPLWRALYENGNAVQYSYLRATAPLALFQTAYSGRPWAVEMPSAGWPLAWSLLLRLRRQGVKIARLTHGAGLSATGDPALDAALPLPERYEIPEETVAAVRHTLAEGGRVIAVGTSVVRALEGAAQAGGGRLVAGEGVTDLRIKPGFVPRIVSGLLSGVHEPAESHYDLLQAFASIKLVDQGREEPTERGYLVHESGDSCIILPGATPSPETRRSGRRAA